MGLRYTDEKQELHAGFGTGVFGGNEAVIDLPRRERGFEEFTWRAALDYEFTSDVHGYISYNRGIKSGGFDVTAPAEPGYEPELLDAYELGVKSELFNNRVRVNAAAFYYDFTDIQVASQPRGATVNAAGARVKGLDLDLGFAATDRLQLTLGASYVDSEYTDFANPVVYPPGPFDPPLTLDNARGNRLTRAPVFTGSAGFDYAIDASKGQFGIAANLYYNSGFFWEPDNNLETRPYGLLNASARWLTPDGRYGVKIWGNNLTDKRYRSQGVGTGLGWIGAWGAPITYGIDLMANF